MYKIMARYYALPDQFGESYVITSDNGHFNTKLEIGQEVDLVIGPEELEETEPSASNNSTMAEIANSIEAACIFGDDFVSPRESWIREWIQQLRQ